MTQNEPVSNDKSDYPVAGPHAKKELMDETKTPGCGVLPPLAVDETNEAPTS
jgi:hypothetical protein